METIINLYSTVKKYDHKADMFCLQGQLHIAIEKKVGVEIDWELIDRQKELSCESATH